ncbi:MAG: ClbS/DfsB family four-helix bundle protein [Pseudomonadota bacterium]
MPASNKAELLAVTEREIAKLQKVLDAVDAELAMPPDEDGTSIKDVIGHRAHWIDLFLGWYHDGQAGQPVHFPAEGYKWNELKRYNADLRVARASSTWQGEQALLFANHTKLVALLTELSEDELYGAPMKGANNHWTVGRWAEAAGPSHFRSAAKYVRGRLRTLSRRDDPDVPRTSTTP